MTHPARFAPDDPLLARVRRICLDLPGTQQKISHGQPVFLTGKVFAVYGGLVKGDHHSDRYARAVLVLPDPDERPALVADPRFFEPAYFAPHGWVGLDLTAARPDWAEVAELVETSFRRTAGKRLIAELDRRG